MPCLEISMPATEPEVKKKLIAGLTKAFDKSTTFGTAIFGICFHEYDANCAASGGKIWDGQAGRPYLHMLLYCPRVDRATKQNLVKSLTLAFTTAIGKDDWKPVIHICEHAYDNIGVEGNLLSDSFEACADSKFYYELPRE